MKNLIYVRRHQVGKKGEEFTFENLISSKMNSQDVTFESVFKSLSVMNVVGIIASSSETSKLKIAELYQKLLYCRKPQSWMRQFKYEDGEWSYEEKVNGMAKYELMTIKKEVCYMPETIITMIINM